MRRSQQNGRGLLIIGQRSCEAIPLIRTFSYFIRPIEPQALHTRNLLINVNAGLTIPPVLVPALVSTPPATVAAYTSAFVVVHPC